MSEAATMTEAEALRGLPKGSKGIDLREKAKVYATDKAPHHVEGEEIEVHPNLAADFIKRGFATKSKSKKEPF